MHTQISLKNDLMRLGFSPCDTVIIHSSMKKIGAVLGGAESVLDAFMDFWGKDGLVVFPTLTYNLGADNLVFDVKNTPCVTGLLPEFFRKRDKVFRSFHPTHSLAAFGKDAAEFTSGHERFDTPCSRLSPWGRLLDRRAFLLFIGTGIACNTFVHGVEEWTIPLDMVVGSELQNFEVIKPNGDSVIVPSRRHIGNHSKYYDKMEKFYEARALIRKGYLGDAMCQIIPAFELHEVLSVLLKSDSFLFTHDSVSPELWNS